MKRRIYLNPNAERILSFALTLVALLILNIVLANTMLKKIQASVEEKFVQDCAEIIEGYATEIQNKLREIESETDIFYSKIAYENNSMEELRNRLLQMSDRLPKGFVEVFFSDKNGQGYNTTFPRMGISDRDYFKEVISGRASFYVSDMLYSKQTNEEIFMFCRPIYTYDNEINGVMCAVYPFEEMNSYFNSINSNIDKHITIRDSQGRFIMHSNPNWVKKVFQAADFIPTDYKLVKSYYADVSQTLNVDGQPIYLIRKHIENTPWVLGYSIPVSEFEELKRTQRNYQFIIFDIIIVVVSIIFLLDLFLHSFFEKHQILSTHIDSLTHLWVRSYFEKEASRLMKHNPKSKFMLIESDISGFKFINQNYGEQKANRCIVQFSKTLIEHTAAYSAITSRGYADHFYTLIKITSVHKAMKEFKASVDKILKSIKGFEIQFTPKFGIAFSIPKNDGPVPIQMLITQAAFAKSTIKGDALLQYSIYDSKLLKKSTAENYIESHMHEALENREFFVMYQPKINLLNDKVVGAEALVRWQSPKLGYMPPDSFIPLFEKNNFVVKLDFYVYEEVCKFLSMCIKENKPVVPISVNMSRNHNKPDKFIHDFVALVKRYEVPPKYIEVELLERSSMDKNVLREITLALHKEGFTVAMDDFGSGESSLNMLSTIPVDVLKFDRSFLYANNKPVELNDTITNFIETLVELGKNLKKQTIFEGVETEEQRDFLRSINCDQVQGFFYSKPLREKDYMDFLTKHN